MIIFFILRTKNTLKKKRIKKRDESARQESFDERWVFFILRVGSSD